MVRTWQHSRRCALAALAVAAAAAARPQGASIEESASAASALERLEQDAESRGAGKEERARRQRIDRASERAALRAIRASPDAPLFRNGVPYLEDWEFRAGATKLLLPAYGEWVNLRRSRKAYEGFLRFGEPGEYLAAALVDRGFMRRTDAGFVNFYGLVWVPQGEAFKLYDERAFAAEKERIKAAALAQREAMGLARADFASFEDYVAFRRGDDASLENFVHGAPIQASESADTLVYFATSLAAREVGGVALQEPMITANAYALVRGKLLRIAFTRQYFSEEDMQGLLAFALAFIDDMRRLNDLPRDRRAAP